MLQKSIGEYEMVLYGDDIKPLWRKSIGPRMSLVEQEREKAEIDDEEEPAKTFDLKIHNKSAFKLTFEAVELADAFERDFVVRQRVMEVGYMTVMQMQEIGSLKLSSRIPPWMRFANFMLLVPATVFALAWQFKGVATNVCQFLLPYECIVPCSKVIQGM
jgi:hypothetical protein